jgi:hypothetical protein
MSETIFISVASYRDDECPSTLEYIFHNADNPHNVYVGICQQNDMSDNSIDIECTLPNGSFINNIRMMRLHSYEAKGPTWARYLCSTLYNNEDYFFQIDSHTKLVKGWDTKCINMMKELKSKGVKHPVLSHYPAAWESFQKGEIGVTRICKSFFNDDNMISFQGAEHIITKEMVPSPYVAGGFLFSEGSLIRDVPFDPTLDYLFVGEEIMHSIRIWTSGYDIYTPNENIAFHEYTRSEKPKIWTDKKYSDKEAFQKVKELIGLSKQENKTLINYKYGLGNIRSLDDYYTFAGIDIKNKKVTKNFCRPDFKDTVSIETFENTRDLTEGESSTWIVVTIVFIIVIVWYIFYNK